MGQSRAVSKERRDAWTICPPGFPHRIPFPLPVPSMLPRGWLWGALGLAANRTAAGQAGIRCLRREPTLCIPASPLPLWPAGLPWDPGVHTPIFSFFFLRIQKSWDLGKGFDAGQEGAGSAWVLGRQELTSHSWQCWKLICLQLICV